MKCDHPATKTRKYRGMKIEYVHACGQCGPCRYTRRQSWIFRHYLELGDWPGLAGFVTLSYAPEFLPGPPGRYGAGSLVKQHAVDFMKRLRENIRPRKVRFVCVGEYGGKRHRPHYHLIVYGLEPLELEIESWRAWSRPGKENWESRRFKGVPMHVSSVLGGREYFGNVKVVEDVNFASIGYVVGYTMKGHTSESNFYQSYPGDTRQPEFTTCSRNPGIGRNGIRRLAAWIQKGRFYIRDHPETNHWGDRGRPIELPNHVEIREAGKVKQSFPLDRFCKAKLAEDLGLALEQDTDKRLLREDIRRGLRERYPSIDALMAEYVSELARGKFDDKVKKWEERDKRSPF